MKMLYVEDDVGRNRPFVNVLTNVLGWDVVWATAPAEAMMKLKIEKEFDIIVVDIMMPSDSEVGEEESELGMSTGIALIDRIRQVVPSGLPIVILSARQDLEYMVNSGIVQAYITKPIGANAFVEKLRAIGIA